MSDSSRNYNATLNSKGLEKSVSEEQARRMCATQGSRSLFIVEAHHGKLVTDEDGTQRIHLVADLVEYVPDEHAERVRRFQRALYLTRPDQFGQEAFDGATANEPTVADTASELDSVVETNDDGEPTGIWQPGDDDNVTEGPWPGDDKIASPFTTPVDTTV